MYIRSSCNVLQLPTISGLLSTWSEPTIFKWGWVGWSLASKLDHNHQYAQCGDYKGIPFDIGDISIVLGSKTVVKISRNLIYNCRDANLQGATPNFPREPVSFLNAPKSIKASDAELCFWGCKSIKKLNIKMCFPSALNSGDSRVVCVGRRSRRWMCYL